MTHPADHYKRSVRWVSFQRKSGSIFLDNQYAFSCMLVLMGEDIHGLQMYRGDASPASCQPYLDSKKDILDRFRSAQSGLIDLLSAVVGPVTEKKG